MITKTKKITALIHGPYDNPGYITSWINDRGYPYQEVNLWKDEPFPDPDTVSLLVIMGGLMNIYEDSLYPWLSKEKDYIKTIIRKKIPVLGICLGGQLMSHCLGGVVTRLVTPEYGWCVIKREKLPERCQDFNYILPEKATVFEWHQDTFTIPERAIPIYCSDKYKNQGFILDDIYIGLQFHPEMEKESIISFMALIEKMGDINDSLYSKEDIIDKIEFYKEGNRFISSILEYLLKKGI